MLDIEPKKLLALANSKEFQRIVASDPLLLSISQPETDAGKELAILLDMFGALSQIGGIDVTPITPAVWSFLWITGNRFVCDRENIAAEDVDQFFYILTHGVKDLGFSIEQLPAQASGIVERAGLDTVKVAGEIIELIQTAFSPLAMIPSGPHPDGECSDPRKIEYGADWIASIVSSVSAMTNLDPATIIFNTPLSACFSYIIQYLRSKGAENIRKRSGPERVIAYNERMDDLTQEFLTAHPDLGD